MPNDMYVNSVSYEGLCRGKELMQECAAFPSCLT